MTRIVIGLTGATGQIYGIQALKLLEDTEHESHLILSKAAEINIGQESEYSVQDVERIADVVHNNDNIGASLASGSFRTGGMLIAPCSMNTLSNISHANSNNLITRSADVILKERRPLVLMPREKPFNRIHIENMLKVTDAGAIVMPPFLSFYSEQSDIEGMVSRTMARALSHLDVEIDYDEWTGLSNS